MRVASLTVVLAALASIPAAQEGYWVGVAGGVKRVDCGGIAGPLVPPATGRDVAVAPDGKVWCVAAGITVLNANGTPFKTITPSVGISPYGIAFDKQGHAWVSGGAAGVEEFDAAGNSLGTVALPASAPLGITVDTQGNKWIAHRVGPPGSVSRIDGATRMVTSHPMPAGSLILPIAVCADARGLLGPSHIWVIGDNRGAGELCELDATGTALNRYVLDAAGKFLAFAADVDSTGTTQNVWVGDWGNGNLHKVNAATGVPTTVNQGSPVYGVSLDGFANVWVTLRTPGVLRRVDPATSNLEVNATIGASGPLATRFQFASAVDPLGDLDADGVPNLAELMTGSSPFDACSTASASVTIEGPTGIGTTTAIGVRAGSGVTTALAFSASVISPGITLPGFGCSVRLDPATLAPFLISVSGPTLLPVTIPSLTSLIGFPAYVQGINIGVPTLTNVAALLFY